MRNLFLRIKKAFFVSVPLMVVMLSATAQKTKSSEYAYTAGAKKYLSPAEMDSLLYSTLQDVFLNYKIPDAVFRQQYPLLKNTIRESSRRDIIRAFQSIESTGNRNSGNHSGTFQDTKELYLKYFKEGIAAAFSPDQLPKLPGFHKSDRITCFRSFVTVQPSGKLLVKESITVYNGNPEPAGTEDASGYSNNEIRRGIIRTFPTKYIGAYKLNYNTGFELKDVELNGQKEPYQIKKSANGYGVQIGKADYLLPEGRYVYDITYETDHQLQSGKEYDELVWNVTGNGWSFHIDSAICTLLLPRGASVLSNACYSGIQGSKASDCTIEYDKTGASQKITFKTSNPLAPREGLTIATSWEKGVIAPPATFEQWTWMARNNPAPFVMAGVILFLLIYNFLAWRFVGKDPERGNIFPQFYPRPDLSPAAMGFLYAQHFEDILVAATVIDLAVRKKITIGVEREGFLFKSNIYHITGPSGDGEKVAYEDFKDDAEELIGTEIKTGKYNQALGDLKTKMKTYCQANYVSAKKKAGFLALNNKYMAPGNLLTGLAFGGLVINFFINDAGQNPWQGLYLIVGLIICILIQKFYYSVIKAYTSEGRKTMNDIEGFRMYLRAADEQRINAMNPPEKTIALYEKYMPYAVALQCEIEWGKQFEDIIKTAALAPATTSGSYSLHSSFVSGHSFSSTFSSNLSGTISSASSPPSSSGGGSSFGGGSSGSGGGGGGGGGW